MLTVAPRKAESRRFQRKMRSKIPQEVTGKSGSKKTVPRSFHQSPCQFGGLTLWYQSEPVTPCHQTTVPIDVATLIGY